MPESFTPKSFRLPDTLIAALEEEGANQTRDATKQLIHILRERYNRKPRVEDKQKTGSLRK